MTESQLCNLVLEATGKTEQELPRFRILALGKLALQRLADIIAKASDDPKMQVVQSHAQALRQLLRKDVQVTVTNGVGDLTAVKTAAEPLMADYIYQAEVYFSGVTGMTRRGQPSPDRAALDWDKPQGFPFFTVAGDELHVRYNGTKPTCTATIRGSVVRSLDNLPPTLNDNFVQIVAFMTTPQGAALVEGEAATEK